MKTSLLKAEGGAVRFKLMLMAGAVAACSPVLASAQEARTVEEVIVTSQRRAENIQDVPISITSFSTEAMDQQGIRAIDDLSRLTPSLTFSRTSGVAGNNGANISIRGIASDVGASTTAIYIDDAATQIRSVGYFSGNTYPRIFDLERVEVLRGPQGTLFGAGAEGGAVRFITPQPSFGDMQVYGRSELSTTKNGSMSGELGVAVGGGISETLAFRASAWARRDGGYIDLIIPQTTNVVDEDINTEDTRSARLALTWKPIDTLEITPSIYYQQVESGGRSQFWERQSDLDDQDYRSGPTSPEPEDDVFTLAALKVEYDFAPNIAFISNTSYFERENDKVLNYIHYQSFLRTGSEFGFFANKDPSNSNTFLHTGQKNFSQEFRLQSYADDQPFDWTIGVYYAKAQQDFQNLTQSGRLPGVISSGFPQYLGRFNLLEIVDAEDVQTAAFASVDWKITDKLTVTVGGRFTQTKFDFSDLRNGPVNSGRETIALASIDDDAFTPKFGIQYDIDEDNMIYASASKGFRPGGGQLPVDPGFCAADLVTLGITASPLGYESDSLWSYEAGTKNNLAGGLVRLDVNAYYIKWKDIQQSVRLPTCGFSYIDNLGSATGKGVDLQIVVNPTEWLKLGLNLGYNDTTFDETIRGGRGLILRVEGDRIGGAQWTGSAFAEGEWNLSDTVEGYARADYSFQSEGISPNSLAFGFDPGLPALPSSDYLTMRAGVRWDRIDVSAFVNNLGNTSDALSRSNNGIGSLLYFRETYRPRTFGVTATYRY
jgi:iron complex outermembrane recepter protein